MVEVLHEAVAVSAEAVEVLLEDEVDSPPVDEVQAVVLQEVKKKPIPFNTLYLSADSLIVGGRGGFTPRGRGRGGY